MPSPNQSATMASSLAGTATLVCSSCFPCRELTQPRVSGPMPLPPLLLAVLPAVLTSRPHGPKSPHVQRRRRATNASLGAVSAAPFCTAPAARTAASVRAQRCTCCQLAAATAAATQLLPPPLPPPPAALHSRLTAAMSCSSATGCMTFPPCSGSHAQRASLTTDSRAASAARRPCMAQKRWVSDKHPNI